MKCWNCGFALSEKDYCTGCGADVKLYKKIMKLSNRYYNDGLEKASVRDLSGAEECLKVSLKLNRKNIRARNLLGLVYYEMGDVVAALSEWVISKSFFSKKNIADDYIRTIQSNPAKLDAINQTIKKYNQALLYCQQGSEDLAIIQLKKVLSMNPKLVKGHQLLALLYIKSGDFDRARRELQRAEKIDMNNTTTLRYKKELDELTKDKQPPKKEAQITYQNGNETIIQPTGTFKESTGLSTVINIAVGLVVGAALIWFLIVPAKTQAVKRETTKQINEYGEELSAKIAAISELENRITSMQQEAETLQQQMQGYTGEGGVITVYNSLFTAASAYFQDNILEAAENLTAIPEIYYSGEENPFQRLYTLISSEVNPKAALELYERGNTAFRRGDTESALSDLNKSIEMDNSNAAAWYLLGRVYQSSNQEEKAKEIFRQITIQFPNTQEARNSAANLGEQGQQQTQTQEGTEPPVQPQEQPVQPEGPLEQPLEPPVQ